MKENIPLNVVHDNELTALLENIGVYESILNGQKKCKFCKEKITIKNLHSLFPESDDIKIVCDKPNCIKNLSEYLNDKNNQ